MDFIPAKTILQKAVHGDRWFGIDYNMNLYKGCSHGCIYCDSRSDCYRIENFDTVRAKKDATDILENELQTKRNKGVIGIGAMSDSYNPLEKQYEITRKALKLISRYGFGVSIETKSDLIVRDIDIFKEISRRQNIIIKLTVTTSDDDLSRIIEPNVCCTSRRFKAIKQLSDNGLFSGVLLTPVLPFITDSEENIRKIIRLSYENGAKFIWSMGGVTLRENQRIYFYSQLDKHFSGLKDTYKNRFGDSYVCSSMNKKIPAILKHECEKYGLLYKMPDIIEAYAKTGKKDRQLSLFH
ncbi:MAG: radical SAM protein [Dysgonamonadaceae bacterium]|jgi:DNA repair photolyase|nr:radical SAM protein [Dysgonamonadaceae bacterium]